MNSTTTQKYANSHFRVSSFYCNVFYELYSVDISYSNFIQRTLADFSFLCEHFCFVHIQIREQSWIRQRSKRNGKSRMFLLWNLILCAPDRLVGDKYKFVHLKADTLRSPKMKRREQSWPTWSTTFEVSNRNLAKSRPSLVIPWNLERF